jgi:hypothetical protein
MKTIDECHFTHFIYENNDEETAERIQGLFAELFEGDIAIIERSTDTDELSISISNFLDTRKDLGNKVRMIFTN